MKLFNVMLFATYLFKKTTANGTLNHGTYWLWQGSTTSWSFRIRSHQTESELVQSEVKRQKYSRNHYGYYHSSSSIWLKSQVNIRGFTGGHIELRRAIPPQPHVVTLLKNIVEILHTDAAKKGYYEDTSLAQRDKNKGYRTRVQRGASYLSDELRS